MKTRFYGNRIGQPDAIVVDVGHEAGLRIDNGSTATDVGLQSGTLDRPSSHTFTKSHRTIEQSSRHRLVVFELSTTSASDFGTNHVDLYTDVERLPIHTYVPYSIQCT